MEGKSFLAGALVGGIGVAVVAWVLPQRDTGLADVETAPSQVVTSGRSEPIRVAPVPLESEPSVPAQSQNVSSAETLPANPEDSTLAVSPNWIETRRAALADEPRDESWAYFTEQAVEQYLAQHPDISQFTVEYIECRSTVCQIGVEGFDESTGPTWQRILYDMRQQPWSEFGQVGSSSGSVEGRSKTITEFQRVTEN
jgi:hypothetical protein